MKFKKLILDIETTGLNLNKGDRIIEICCLEIVNRKITKNIFHNYINTEKAINYNAYLIHGITNEFLKNKPIFIDIVNEFLNFISNAYIIVHNSDFDISFINFELNNIGFKNFSFYCKKIIDTLKLAKKLFPNKRNSLNHLCKRFNINTKIRKFHGALLDSILLAKVYLYMTRNQKKLNLLNINKTKLNYKIKDPEYNFKSNNYDLYKHLNFFKFINN